MDLSFTSDLALTALMSVASLIAVWVPLQRGLVTFFRGRRATRRVGTAELRNGGDGAADSLAVLMARVLAKSLRENQGAHPREFVLDATKQFVMHEYEIRYARVISMYANLLPPLGFIGTTAGLLILFLSMHMADASLELGALAVALLSSVFALIGFAALEGLKIRLYGRLLTCLDDVFSLQRAADSRGSGRSAEVPAAATAR